MISYIRITSYNVCYTKLLRLVMTASAIGDNLVQKDILLKLSKLNRNFLVKRNLPPRELLQSSKVMSEYIYQLLEKENRSVWVAQREGRTKDGNDATHQGVLKMIAMAAEGENCMDYFKKLRIVITSYSIHYTKLYDVERGTFSHRHAVVKVEDSEEEVVLLNEIVDKKGNFYIYNSLLSEYGVLGFEYGYALASPKTLTIWEAQFGDFSNGAQIMMDSYNFV